MKIIIAGSRHMPDTMYHLIDIAMHKSGFRPHQIISGCARGTDRLGEAWAAQWRVDVAQFPANWDTYGKAAGFIRNKQMADAADAAIVFIWDNSRGSKNMIETMQKLGKPVYVCENGVIA